MKISFFLIFHPLESILIGFFLKAPLWIFKNSWKFESGASKNYISTKARQLDPQKPDNFFYFLIRKVVFSSKIFCLPDLKLIGFFCRK